jgi:hypothetical protein
MQEVKPEGGKTLCADCPYWKALLDDPELDEYGQCQHTSEPWHTADRVAEHGHWANVTTREESCLLPTEGEL